MLHDMQPTHVDVIERSGYRLAMTIGDMPAQRGRIVVYAAS